MSLTVTNWTAVAEWPHKPITDFYLFPEGPA